MTEKSLFCFISTDIRNPTEVWSLLVSRAQRSTSGAKWCAADPGPRLFEAQEPDQRCTATQELRAAPHPGHVSREQPVYEPARLRGFAFVQTLAVEPEP